MSSKHRGSAAIAFLGGLLIFISSCMFMIAHQHHAQLRVEPFVKLDRRTLEERYNFSDDDNIYGGEFITDILQGMDAFPDNRRLKFRPGTLAMDSAQTIQHCYVDMGLYRSHFDKLLSVQASVSDKHKLIYRNIPKSASSSSRHIMKDFFEGEDARVKHVKMNEYVQKENYTLVSFIRDPLDRFYSAYDEAFIRMGPWWGESNFAQASPGLAKLYTSNQHKLDPYPYLYEGIHTMDDFRKLYCPHELLEQNGTKCVDAETIDDGDLTSRFEQFVRDYDGREPFDNHLKLQVAFLVYNSRSNGNPLPVSAIYNASEAEKGWNAIASEHRVEIPKDGMVHGRKSVRRFNMNLVSNATKQKICRISALDYCCLNLELPEVCRSNDSSENVLCVLEQRTHFKESSPFRIQHWRSNSLVGRGKYNNDNQFN